MIITATIDINLLFLSLLLRSRNIKFIMAETVNSYGVLGYGYSGYVFDIALNRSKYS